MTSRVDYFSLAGGAPAIWERLISGASADEIVAAFGGAGEAEEEVRDLLERLVGEGLIVPAGDATNGNGAEPAAIGSEFEKPVVEKYDDLKDYFLIDPIHEVDATGWPKPAP